MALGPDTYISFNTTTLVLGKTVVEVNSTLLFGPFATKGILSLITAYLQVPDESEQLLSNLEKAQPANNDNLKET